MALVHHELCFGCGRTNLFGLLGEFERGEDGVIRGRCFIKQDHQGPVRGQAHEGVIATALSEAMAFAANTDSTPQAITVGYLGGAPVGEYLDIEAEVLERTGTEVTTGASAHAQGTEIARARGTYEHARR